MQEIESVTGGSFREAASVGKRAGVKPGPSSLQCETKQVT